MHVFKDLIVRELSIELSVSLYSSFVLSYSSVKVIDLDEHTDNSSRTRYGDNFQHLICLNTRRIAGIMDLQVQFSDLYFCP